MVIQHHSWLRGPHVIPDDLQATVDNAGKTRWAGVRPGDTLTALAQVLQVEPELTAYAPPHGSHLIAGTHHDMLRERARTQRTGFGGMALFSALILLGGAMFTWDAWRNPRSA